MSSSIPRLLMPWLLCHSAIRYHDITYAGKLILVFHKEQGKSEGFESCDRPIVRKHPIWVKIGDVFSRVTLKFDGWSWKTIGHLSFAVSSFVQHFVGMVNSNWSYSPETPNLGQNRRFFEPCDLEIWRMILKNNRAPLLSIIKLYASFHHHMWIQTGVTVRKQLSWVVTCDLDLWPVTLTFCMDVTSVTGNNSWKFHDDMMMGT